MSTVDDRSRARRSGSSGPIGHGGPPTFPLRGLFDDPKVPTALTVFPANPERDVTTEWLTIDVAHAVRLIDMC